MSIRHTKLIAALAATALLAGGATVWSLMAGQAQTGELSQTPLTASTSVKPALIMAVDDSGSMTFQTMFPGNEGMGCINHQTGYFHSGTGSNTQLLAASANNDPNECNFAYTSIGRRIGYHAIPPIDRYGFARSSEWNPVYFNPAVKYEPWVYADGTSYGDASRTATKIHPGDENSPTINLASLVTHHAIGQSNNSLANQNVEFFRFTLWWGMHLPAGTRVRIINSSNGTSPGNHFCQDLPRDEGRPNGARDENLRNPNNNIGGIGTYRLIGAGGHTVRAVCSAFIEHWPATFFMPYTSNNDSRPVLDGENAYASVPRVRVDNACGSGCHMWKYTIQPENTQALQNFANWYSYYASRHRATIAGITRAMADVENMRVGYFAINDGRRSNADIWDQYHNVQVAMRDMDVSADRVALHDSVVGLKEHPLQTPNIHAVAHIGSQFRRTGSSAPIQNSCQRNVGMLFTDGYASVRYSGSDAPARNNSLGRPFNTTYANTMAAVTSYYYENNLRPDLPAGRLPVPDACNTLDPNSTERKRLNCQANQHMTFYGITLGGQGTVYNPGEQQDPFVNPLPTWPNPDNYRHPNNHSDPNLRNTRIMRTPRELDDLWHATINGRGELLYAQRPMDVVNAMRRVLSSVTAAASEVGTQSQTGARLGLGSFAVEPGYEISSQSDWWGKLTLYQASLSAGGQVVTTPAWSVNDRLQEHDDRNRIFFSSGSGTGSSGVKAFTASNLGSLEALCGRTGTTASTCVSDIQALGANATLVNAVAYLRGDTSQERRNGGPFRSRSAVLGDIVNSVPVISSPTDDYGYGALAGNLGTSYTSYLETKKNRRYMVYAGANGGMLHAFDAGLTRERILNGQGVGSSGGTEVFAYIPGTSLKRMANLLQPTTFEHLYYVDGQIAVSDAYWGSSWKTVLVGASGAGGRSVFGLNVSNPAAFGAGSRLWEIDEGHAAGDDLGHVLGKPLIHPVRKSDGSVTWVAIFGNGYESENNRPVLFLVEIGTGVVTRIVAKDTSAPVHGRAGLGNVVALDRWSHTGGTGGGSWLSGSDGLVDTVYAGDQSGRVWKFDLRRLNWDGENNEVTTPLFRTQVVSGNFRQPVTGGLTTATGTGGAVMVYFGTGSFSYTGDDQDTSGQSLYAIRDAGQGPVSTVSLGSLSKHTAYIGQDGAYRLNLGNDGSAGWYVDLIAGEGERILGSPSAQFGLLEVFTYRLTAGASTNECRPASGGNRLFRVNALTGTPGFTDAGEGGGAPGGGGSGGGVAAVDVETGGSAPLLNVSGWVIMPGEADQTGGAGWYRPDGSNGWLFCGSNNQDAPPADGDCEWHDDDPRGDEGGAAPIGFDEQRCLYRSPYFPAVPDAPIACGRLSWRQLQ